MKTTIVLFLLMMCWSAACVAQEKKEYEYRVKKEVVPLAAQNWLHDVFEEKKKLKWYFEESSEHSSYEAKFIRNGVKHSVEFSTDGVIQDIEMERACKYLPEGFMQGFRQYLHDTYKKYKVFKVQEQLSGSPEALAKAVQTNQLSEITTRYEVEYYGKTMNDEEEEWEGLFSENGELIERRKIVFTPATNLLF